MADPLTAGPRAVIRRRALAVAIWLALAVLLGGLDLPARGLEAFRFAPFGIVSGLLALLWVFALVHVGVIWRPAGWPGPFLLVYWVAATAMAFRILMPPPGLVQVALAVAAAVAAGIVVSRVDRSHAIVWAGIVAVGLATIRFGLVPAFQARSNLPDWGPLRFGDAANAMRDFLVAYDPERPASQALHFGALVAWAVALWTQWNPPSGTVAGDAPSPRRPDESPRLSRPPADALPGDRPALPRERAGQNREAGDGERATGPDRPEQ